MIDFIKKMLGFGPAPTTPGALAQPWPFPVSAVPEVEQPKQEAAPVKKAAKKSSAKKAPAKKVKNPT
jgi:capsular polysaccharide biosynthesis protein